MTFTVTNQRDDSRFPIEPTESILDAALRDNRIFPYGCRSGVCGACKCTLVSGQVDYGDYEDFALPEAEKQQGKVLLCQARALQDLVIDVEQVKSGVSVQIRTLPCRVTKIDQCAKDVVRLFLALPRSQQFNFVPGQYIDILLKDGHRRSFSIANLPTAVAEDGIELHIRHVVGGHFTPNVFATMKERDLLRFEGPFGTYFLRSEENTPLIMVAGGTGFSPIKGLIEQIIDEKRQHRIHLFWGARDEQDLYLDDLARQWLSQLANFTYTPVLSDSESDSWPGETGYVHQSVERHYASVSKYDIYASGPPVMIDAIRQSLLARGMHESRFYFDSFDFAPPT